jgi:hypothetical protein
VIAFLMASCVSVSQEAVVLSSVVGVQIAEHRASHEAFVQRYYDRSRDVVEMFLRDRWVPEYLETFVRESQIGDLLTDPTELFHEDDVERLREELMALSGIGEARTEDVLSAVGRAFGHAERGRILLEFAQVAMAEIEVQRSELLDPLDRQEQEVLEHLAESYAQLQQAQAQVTAYLASVQEVTRSQDEVLETMGIRELRDDTFDRAVRLSERLAAVAKSGTSAAEALEEMKALIGSGEPGEWEE